MEGVSRSEGWQGRSVHDQLGARPGYHRTAGVPSNRVVEALLASAPHSSPVVPCKQGHRGHLASSSCPYLPRGGGPAWQSMNPPHQPAAHRLSLSAPPRGHPAQPAQPAVQVAGTGFAARPLQVGRSPDCSAQIHHLGAGKSRLTCQADTTSSKKCPYEEIPS